MKSKLLSIFSVLIILFFTVAANAQEKYVSGVVTTAHRFPLNKVKVTSGKTGTAVYTDSLGRFNMNSVEKDVLTVAASGFESRKIKIGKEKTYLADLMFKDNVTNFNEAVNGGHISESALKEAVAATLTKNKKDYSTYNNIFELISSEIYEVRVDHNSIYNKKIRSLNSNPQVLLVVDSKVVSDISFVIPADVARIEFIDDAGATMYGVQGANGILKITLK
jgi:hypothetical protein